MNTYRYDTVFSITIYDSEKMYGYMIYYMIRIAIRTYRMLSYVTVGSSRGSSSAKKNRNKGGRDQ